MTFGDLGADPPVAADRPGKKTVHVQPELVLEHGAGGASGIENVLRQREPIEIGRIEEIELLVVVGNQGNVALFARHE